MNFNLDGEQRALRDAARGLLARTYGDAQHRRSVAASEPGFDRKVYQQLAELGFLGLHFSESDGGAGATLVETGIVAKELGRVLAPEPYLAVTVIGGGLIAAVASEEQRSKLLTRLTAGELLVVLAHDEGVRQTGGGAPATAVTATEADGSWTLSGYKEPVLFGAEADLLLVSAALPGGGTGLFLVERDAAGLRIARSNTLGGGPAARVTLDAAPGTPLGVPGVDVSSQLGATLDVARVLGAQEALGAMEVALTMTLDYLKQRRQFGVTLNHFQALTFRAADMYLELELADSMVQWATMVAADGEPAATADAATRASLQVAHASRVIGQDAIQLHGGIGMTAEHSIGAYVQRLTALMQMSGVAEHHLSSLSGRVFDYEVLDPLDLV
jgi:alkylation response protein AidB-like acyl-CoA dehydrogenase